MDSGSSVRVDSWVWAVRIAKTRSAATTACRAGHVQVNGERVKAAQPVHVGDEVRVRTAETERTLRVARLITKRVSATVAAECFIDLAPPALPRAEVAATVRRDRGAGRPTKRDRRDIERLRGH